MRWFGQARERAYTVTGGPSGLRDKAAEVAARAGTAAARGVDAAATGVDRMTKGRYRDRIENMAGRVESALDRGGRR